MLKGRYCVASLLFALVCSAPNAQLSGPLSGTLAPGFYVVEGNIYVQEGDSLIIEPGVNLGFSGPYSFEIYGHLHASGTEQDSISFCPLDSSIEWAGIKFYSPPPDSSLLEYCLISGSMNSGIVCQQSCPAFKHCTIRDNSSTGYGGGVDIENSSPLISDCIIRCNFSQNFGGGIALRQSPNAILEYCTIDSNDSNEGDGMGLYGYVSDPLILYCNINDNERGGARLESSNPTLSHCTFKGNGSEGIFLLDSHPTFDYCTFTENLIGIQMLDSNPSVIRCTVKDNQLFGIDCHNSYPTISFCVIYGNDGVGVQIYSDAHPTIHNTTICMNGGSGIYCPIGGSSCRNCIIAGNAGYGIEFGYGDEVQYCDIWGNGEGVYYGNPPLGFAQISSVNANGDSCDVYYNIFMNPQLVDSAQNDYRLQWGSPCIDAGDPDPQFNDPDSTIADIGAYYYDQSIPVRILLTPHQAPIEIPAGGGSFDYTIWLTNIDPSLPQIETWTDVTLPDETIFGPLLGPVLVALDSGVTVDRERTQIVPAGAPAGTYSYNAHAVVNADTSTDSFTFVKLGSDRSDGLAGWFNTGESITEIGGGRTPALQKKITLQGAFPNPFNVVTVLSFELRAACFVKLEVFDINGRRVWAHSRAPLQNGWLDPGIHRVIFDGSGLASGVYIYRLQAGDFRANGKMVLMK